LKKIFDKKKTNKKKFSLNFFEGIIAFGLWQISLYIINDDLGLVANIFVFVITYLIASNIIRKYFKD
tara:strand:- start:200 stop:400 length:201 start_codon:yes stop_codon:yes gene_type:complete